MSQLPRKPEPESTHSAHVRSYNVEFKPRSFVGRTIFGVIATVLVIAGFVFFSVFLAIGLALLVLAIVIGLLRQLAPGKSNNETLRSQAPKADPPHTPTIIDVEQSSEDGVYRPRDNSTSN